MVEKFKLPLVKLLLTALHTSFITAYSVTTNGGISSFNFFCQFVIFAVYFRLSDSNFLKSQQEDWELEDNPSK